MPEELNELLNGEFTESTVDGKTVITYKDGKKEGIMKYISSSGVVIAEIEYHDDVMNGVMKQFTQTGTLLIEMTYKDGKQNGPFISYHSNGMRQLVSNYENGFLHGDFKVFDEFGDLITECTYDHGKKQGKNIVYYPMSSGGGVYELSYYEDDLLTGDKTTFYSTGEILSITPYIKGKAQSYTKTFMKDGKELKKS